jgi:hypothetical protein
MITALVYTIMGLVVATGLDAWITVHRFGHPKVIKVRAVTPNVFDALLDNHREWERE